MVKAGEKAKADPKKNGKSTPSAEMLSNKEPDLKELLLVTRVDMLNIQHLLTDGRFDLSGKEAMEVSNLRIRIAQILAPKKVVPKAPVLEPSKRK